eukprot:scaffold3457_cov230-Pinguiococcus_pyrenoidosus.AAC.4
MRPGFTVWASTLSPLLSRRHSVMKRSRRATNVAGSNAREYGTSKGRVASAIRTLSQSAKAVQLHFQPALEMQVIDCATHLQRLWRLKALKSADEDEKGAL